MKKLIKRIFRGKYYKNDESYVDTIVKVIICVVVGALLLTSDYAVGKSVLESAKNKVNDFLDHNSDGEDGPGGGDTSIPGGGDESKPEVPDLPQLAAPTINIENGILKIFSNDDNDMLYDIYANDINIGSLEPISEDDVILYTPDENFDKYVIFEIRLSPTTNYCILWTNKTTIRDCIYCVYDDVYAYPAYISHSRYFRQNENGPFYVSGLYLSINNLLNEVYSGTATYTYQTTDLRTAFSFTRESFLDDDYINYTNAYVYWTDNFANMNTYMIGSNSHAITKVDTNEIIRESGKIYPDATFNLSSVLHVGGIYNITVVAKVSGHADSNQSNNAEYEIIPQTPVIAYQPQSATYRIDKEADAINFCASVSDGGVLSYQWQSSSDGITYSDIPGETFSYFYPNTSVMNEWSGVFLEGSTRNGLTQDVHLNSLANSRRTGKLILEWYENNPNGTCQECSDATGISLRTVKKYHPGREKPYKPKKAAPKNQRIPKTCPDCGGELIKEIKGPWVCKVECCA